MIVAISSGLLEVRSCAWLPLPSHHSLVLPWTHRLIATTVTSLVGAALDASLDCHYRHFIHWRFPAGIHRRLSGLRAGNPSMFALASVGSLLRISLFIWFQTPPPLAARWAPCNNPRKKQTKPKADDVVRFEFQTAAPRAPGCPPGAWLPSGRLAALRAP